MPLLADNFISPQQPVHHSPPLPTPQGAPPPLPLIPPTPWITLPSPGGPGEEGVCLARGPGGNTQPSERFGATKMGEGNCQQQVSSWEVIKRKFGLDNSRFDDFKYLIYLSPMFTIRNFNLENKYILI